MAKGDSWDKLGKTYDPLGVYDANGDGVHSMSEALDAEFEYYRTTEEPKHYSGFVSDLGDDIDDDGDYIDSDIDDDFGTENDAGCNVSGDDGATFYTTATFSVGSDSEDDLTPEEERLKNTREYLKDLSQRSNLDESEVLEKKRARFILKNNCLAAKYCEIFCGFDFNKAIFNELKLPKEYLDNYDIDDTLNVNLDRIKSYSVQSACAILKWIYKEFAPYREFDREKFGRVSAFILSVDEDDYKDELYKFIRKQSDFVAEIFRYDVADFNKHTFKNIAFEALHQNDTQTALKLTKAFLLTDSFKPMTKISWFSDLAKTAIYKCDIKAAKLYLEKIHPLLGTLENNVTAKAITEIKENVKDFFKSHGDDIEEAEEEPVEKTVKNEYAWRERYNQSAASVGLNPADFDNEGDCRAAIRRATILQHEEKLKAESEKRDALLADKTVYKCCKVYVKREHKCYIYMVGNIDIRLGDNVVVPFGQSDEVLIGVVVAIEECIKAAVPFPIEKVKSVIRKCEQ